MLVDYSMRKWKKRPYWWIFRRLIRVMDFFIQGHYCDAENVAENVRRFGTRRDVAVLPDQLLHMEKYEKVPHNTFTVLYYFPTGGDVNFRKWLYGYDIFMEVTEVLPELRYIVINGNNDMKYVYPYVDFYLRPNRHDGASRLRRECEIQGIPYYWTQRDPNTEDVIRAIKKVMEENN
jgi:hypothetical protein